MKNYLDIAYDKNRRPVSDYDQKFVDNLIKSLDLKPGKLLDIGCGIKRTMNLFNSIAKLNLNLTWDASNGLIASSVVAHPELMSAAKESGCIGAYFGIESGNDQI